MSEIFVPPIATSSPGLVQYIINLGNDLVGCELGVCRGYNVRYLLDRLPNVNKMYAIDPWKAYTESYTNDVITYIEQEIIDGWEETALKILEPVKNRIHIIKKPSSDAAGDILDNSLDFIFIDGDHSYDAVLFDCSTYWDKVKSGGLFSGHDWNLPGVKNAVEEFRNQNNITTEIQFTNNDVWFWYK